MSLFLGLAKLWLISREEIVARAEPYDDLFYLRAAKEWYWFGSYTNAPYGTPPFIRPAVYPLFLAITKLSGIPLRISIELLFLIAAFVFVWTIVKAGLPWFMGILLYAAIIFHPASFELNNLALPTFLYAPVLLLALACMILLLLKQEDPHRLRWAILTGIVLAVLWHIRSEGILLLGLLAVYGLGILATMGLRRRQRSAALKHLGVMVLVPALVIAIGTFTLRAVNYFKFGLFAVDVFAGSGFESVNKALLRIKPVTPIRFVPVPREVRQRAYRVSPAFRELASYLEGGGGLAWASGAKAAGVQVDGEIGGGHSQWSLIVGAYYIGYNKSAGQADQYFQRVADEVNAACDDGRLQCRWVPTSFLDPHTENYLSYLPESLGRVSKIFFFIYVPGKAEDRVSPEVRIIFDEIANRRRTLSAPDSFTVLEGWAFSSKDSLQRIIVRDRAGTVLASTQQFTPRADIVSLYEKVANAPLNTGYRLEFSSASAQPVQIVFVTQSGKEWTVPHTGKLHGIGGSPESVTYSVDVDETFTNSEGLQTRVQSFIGFGYSQLTTILSYLGLASLLVLAICYRFINLKDKVYLVLILVAAAVVSRVFLFALIDASAFRAAYDFYLFPVLYLYTCVLLLLTSQAGRTIATVLGHYGIMRRIDFRKLYKKSPPVESS
jgi:hypothetical protein